MIVRSIGRNLHRRPWRLAAEAAATLAVASLRVRLVPFSRLVRSAARPLPTVPAAPEVDRLRRVTEAVAFRMPFRAKCLEQALALRSMLRRRGIASVLHYGIRNDGSGLSAHAWLTIGGKIVIGGSSAAQFAEVATFGDGAAGA